METIVTALYENRRKTVRGAAHLSESAEIHREIYQAIRTRNAASARKLMEQHLRRAEVAQLDEKAETVAGSESRPPAPPMVQASEEIQPGTEPS
jgi:GntR family transcriptional regulator, transcriptional repressor for pyruvate dehydrogenase complex